MFLATRAEDAVFVYNIRKQETAGHKPFYGWLNVDKTLEYTAHLWPVNYPEKSLS